jgi:hypothetical protein
MEILILLLLIAAAVCFFLAVISFTARINLLALGLLFWVFTAVLRAFEAV